MIKTLREHMHMLQQAQKKIIGKIWGNLYLNQIGISAESIRHLNIEVLSMEHIYQEFMLQIISPNKLENNNGNILIGKNKEMSEIG